MTTDNRKVQLEVGVDATGARAGFDQVKAGAKDMAQAVAQAGQLGAKGLDAMGSGGTAAAANVDKAARSMIGSVQRATAALQAGERGSASYFETLAKQRGVSADVLKPYIDQLKAAEAAQAAASGSLNKMGVSAAQTAAALRNVPAQFTDIVVSLQSGQAPLTVLLQQGGQLKDMFGGVGNAARAIGGYVLGLVNPFALAAGAVGALGYAALSASKDVSALREAIILTGRQGVTSLSQLNSVAEGLGAVGVSSSAASEALVTFITTGAKVDDRLQSITKSAIDLDRLGGAAIADTAKKYVALAKDPLADIDRLTLATYKQIEALLEQGKRTDAVKVAQDAFIDSNRETAKSLAASLGPLDVATNAWKGYASAVLNGVKAAAAGVAGVFSPATGDQQRAELQKRRDQYAKLGYDTTKEDAQLEYFRRVDIAQQQSIEAARREVELRGLLANFNKDDEAAKRLRDRNQLLADNTKLLEANQITQAQFNKSIADFDDRNKTKGPTARAGDPFADKRAAAQEWADYYQSFTDLTDKATGKTEGLSAAQLKLQQYLVSPAYSNATEQMRQLVLQQAYGAISAEEFAKSQMALVKAQAEFASQRDADLRRAGAEIVAINDRAQAMENEVIAYGLGKEALVAMTIARLEERKAILQGFEGSAEQIQLIEQEIAARQRLAEAQDSYDAKDASDKAAKKAQADWKNAADKIESSITDALMRGFESGKSFAENLRDTVVNMFKSLVLRPVVQAIVAPVASALAGGGSSAAFAGQGGGTLNTAMQAKSLYDTVSGAFTSLGSSITTAASKMGLWLVENTTGALQKAGIKLYNSSGMLGTAGAYVGGALAGYGIGTAISGGRSAFGDGNGDVATLAGTAIGAFFGGPIGAAIGGSIGGLVNRAFGQGPKESTGSGITGTFSGGSFSGRSFNDWRRAGGLFTSGSSGTDYSELSGSVQANLGKVYGQITTQTAALATALGVPTDQILGYVKSIRLDVGGDSTAAITKLFENIADELASTFVSSSFVRESERSSVALTRMVTALGAVNTAFDALNKTALSASLLGGDSASKLVDLFGGVEKFNSATTSYYQQFYTEAERNAKTAEQLAESFGALGVAVPDSLQAYRDLVNAQDVTTESGRTMYTALIGLSGAFATVSNAATATAQSLIKAASFSSYVDYAAAAARAGSTPPPRFAGGGLHSGGLRIVGENGPELEATGQSRIWNDQQLRKALQGNGSDATAAEVRALAEEQRAQSRALVSLNNRLVKIFDRWDATGMPEVRTV